MTEYSKVINCSQILRNILVIAKKKKLNIKSNIKLKHIKLTVKRTIGNIWRSDQTNVYIRALSKQKGTL